MDDLIVLLKVLNLLHDLFENFGAVLWRIAVFYKADLDLQLQLIADVLIVQPVSKRRFGIDDLFDLLRQSLALVVDDNTVNLFIGSVSISCFLFDRNLLCVAAPRIIRTTVELAILSPAANQKSTALWAFKPKRCHSFSCLQFLQDLQLLICGLKGRIAYASNVFVYTKTLFALQNACWGVPQTPLICIFQCRLRVPAGRFLPGDALRVIEDLHKV